jgi:hypothetical protein
MFNNRISNSKLFTKLYSIDRLKIIYYSCMLIFDLLWAIGLIYCWVIDKYKFHIVVENKHLFSFMAPLEGILTIFYIYVYEY